MEVWRACRYGGLEEVEGCGDGRKLWRRQEALIRLLTVADGC
jgi:hypothetical protein